MKKGEAQNVLMVALVGIAVLCIGSLVQSIQAGADDIPFKLGAAAVSLIAAIGFVYWSVKRGDRQKDDEKSAPKDDVK